MLDGVYLYTRGYGLEISREACTDTTFFCRRVDADENEIGVLDSRVDICGKEKIAPPGFPHDVLETWFVDRECKVMAVPGIDP